MAIACITIKCAECGKDYEIRKKCFNRTEANNYEAWAADHITLCKTCNMERKRTIELEEVSEFVNSLPKIVGKSEKQITYAKNLRDNLIMKLKNSLKEVSVDYFRKKFITLVSIPDHKLIEYSDLLPKYLLPEGVEVTDKNLHEYKNDIRKCVLEKSRTAVTLEMFSFILSDAGQIIDCISNYKLNFEKAIKDVQAQGFEINEI